MLCCFAVSLWAHRALLRLIKAVKPAGCSTIYYEEYSTSGTPYSVPLLAAPFIIFMHLAFLHLLPLCLLLRLRRNDFSMLRYDLSFLQIPQAGASYHPLPLAVPALLPLASMPAVSLVGLVDTPTHSLVFLLPPFTMGNTTCTSFRMPFLLPCSARFMSSSNRTYPG